MRLGVQRTQYPHSVPIGQHNGRANVAADVGGLGNNVEVPEPVKHSQSTSASHCVKGV